MKDLFLILSFSAFLIFPLQAQVDTVVHPVQENSLLNQMNKVFEQSNSYQKYKVIDKAQLEKLKRNILDSISKFETTLTDQQSSLARQQGVLDSLQSNLLRVQSDLEASQEKENSIRLLGISTSKSTYNLIFISIIFILVFLGGIFFYRYSTSHKLIRESRSKVNELEEEIEELRRKNLEREQKLRRKLQDEINKNKGIR